MTAWLLETFLATALLALAVAVVCVFMPRRPALCHALWLLVLLRFLVPPVLTWAELRGVFPSAVETAAEEEGALNVATATGAAPAALSIAPAAIGNALNFAVVDTARRRWLFAGLGILWALGALTVVLLQGRGLIRHLRGLRHCEEAPECLRRMVAESAASLGVKPPRVCVAPDAHTAYTLHLRRRWLVLPRTLVDALEEDGLRALLVHEMAHFKRRDHWWAWPEMAALALWWWHPALWWTRRRLHVCREAACDAWVVDTLPESRRAYADTLVRAVELLVNRRTPAPVLGMGAGAAAAFERRFTMVMRESVSPHVRRAGVLLVVLLAVLVVPTWLGAEDSVAKTSSDYPPPTEELLKKLSASVSVDFEDKHIGALCLAICDSYDFNISTDPRAVPAPVETEQLRISGPPEVSVPGMPDHALSDGIVQRIRLDNTTVDNVLETMLQPLGLVYVPTENHVWITSEAWLAYDRKIKAAAPPHGRATLAHAGDVLRKQLLSTVSIEFEAVHIAKLLGFVTDSYKFNIMLDVRAVLPPYGRDQGPPVPGPDMVTNGRIDYLRVACVPLAEALDVMLRKLNLTYVVEKDHVWVTSYALLGVPPEEPVPAPAEE